MKSIDQACRLSGLLPLTRWSQASRRSAICFAVNRCSFHLRPGLAALGPVALHAFRDRSPCRSGHRAGASRRLLDGSAKCAAASRKGEFRKRPFDCDDLRTQLFQRLLRTCPSQFSQPGCTQSTCRSRHRRSPWVWAMYPTLTGSCPFSLSSGCSFVGQVIEYALRRSRTGRSRNKGTGSQAIPLRRLRDFPDCLVVTGADTLDISCNVGERKFTTGCSGAIPSASEGREPPRQYFQVASLASVRHRERQLRVALPSSGN
jgi:hypothetical protein